MAVVLPNNHSFIYLGSRGNEQLPPGLQIKQGVRHGFALAVRHNGTGIAHREIAPVGFVAGQVRIHNPGAPGIGHEFITVTNQGTGGNGKLNPDPAPAIVNHIGHFTFADGQFFSDNPHEVFITIHKQMLNGFQCLTVFLLIYNPGAPHADLEIFPAHGLNEDGKLEFPPALYHKTVLITALFNGDGHIEQGFLEQTLTDFPGLHKFAFLA